MRRVLSTTIAAVVTAAVAVAVVTAGAAGSDDRQSRLAGTWQATVIRPAPLPPLPSLQIYTSDGSAIEMSNEPQASRTPLFASWKRISGRLYTSSGVHFLFNAQTGALTGSRKIDRTIELASDRQSFSAVARVTTYDANGNELGRLLVPSFGSRMPVDRIPERP